MHVVRGPATMMSIPSSVVSDITGLCASRPSGSTCRGVTVQPDERIASIQRPSCTPLVFDT